MRSRIVLMSFAALFLLWATGAVAQTDGLAEKFRQELSPQPSQKTQSIPESRTKGVAAPTSPPTHEVEGVIKPSATINLEFKFNSGEPTPEAVRVLNELGKAIQSPELRKYAYKVEGHTDSVGTDAYNLELSRRRALAVVDYLVKTFALQREQFHVEAFGETKPIATNDTEAGRARNRRVVVVNTLETPPLQLDARPKIAVKVIYARAKDEKELREGDTLTQRDNYAIEFTPQTRAHVYVYQVDTRGSVEKLFPNEQYSQSSSLVEPGQLYRIPSIGKWLRLDENKGEEHIVVVAKKAEIKDPFKVCRKVLGSDRIVIASADSKQTTTKGVGGKRETLDGPEPSMDDVFQWKLSFHHQ